MICMIDIHCLDCAWYEFVAGIGTAFCPRCGGIMTIWAPLQAKADEIEAAWLATTAGKAWLATETGRKWDRERKEEQS